MSITQATPYLFFNGTAAQAIEFYGNALGAKPQGNVLRYGDHMEACPEADKHRVMHAMLQIGEASVMLSDAPDSHPAKPGGSVQIALQFNDLGQTTTTFAALAEGGTVISELHDAFWGDKFGVLQDRFGIHWMFTCPLR